MDVAKEGQGHSITTIPPQLYSWNENHSSFVCEALDLTKINGNDIIPSKSIQVTTGVVYLFLPGNVIPEGLRPSTLITVDNRADIQGYTLSLVWV